MTVKELIAQLLKAQAELGSTYDPQVRFYTDMKQDRPDDELDTEPTVEVDFDNEPTTVSVNLYLP